MPYLANCTAAVTGLPGFARQQVLSTYEVSVISDGLGGGVGLTSDKAFPELVLLYDL